MKTIYLECNMGASGDMLLAALLELHPDPDGFLARLNHLGLPGVTVTREARVRRSIRGTGVKVNLAPSGNASCSAASLSNIEEMLAGIGLPEPLRDDVTAVYHRVAEAESAAHGVPVAQVHFHELGMLDAVADILGVCMLLRELAPERLLASPVNVGSGQAQCGHGLLPVPAPATARILRGVPVYSSGIQGELCTPTGAALLRHFVAAFVPLPQMRIDKIGYGMGEKEFSAVNCVRALFGETDDPEDQVAELCCNLDDMTPEAVGFAMELLLEKGALDVYTTPVGMKKCRPGVLLTCLCRLEQRDTMIQLLFRHTTTLGIRERQCRRYVLSREEQTISTKYGPVRSKRSSGYGLVKEKPEYDSLAAIAREQGLSLLELSREIESEQPAAKNNRNDGGNHGNDLDRNKH